MVLGVNLGLESGAWQVPVSGPARHTGQRIQKHEVNSRAPSTVRDALCDPLGHPRLSGRDVGRGQSPGQLQSITHRAPSVSEPAETDFKATWCNVPVLYVKAESGRQSGWPKVTRVADAGTGSSSQTVALLPPNQWSFHSRSWREQGQRPRTQRGGRGWGRGPGSLCGGREHAGG